MSMADLLFDRHNPDVLTCIANLSNDEVFTPPEMAGAMLDLVADAWAKDHDGANLWAKRGFFCVRQRVDLMKALRALSLIRRSASIISSLNRFTESRLLSSQL